MIPITNAFVNPATKNELTPETKAFILDKFGFPAATEVGTRIGGASAHGAIFPVGLRRLVVLKVIYKDSDFSYEFGNEVRVGRIPGVERVGTKIYNSIYGVTADGRYFGAYLMDNLFQGETNANTELLSLTDWIKRYQRAGCPPEEEIDIVVYKYVELLFDFYKITKGWHGDMHSGNVQVLVDRRTGLIKRMRVIDYGTHMPFKNQAKLAGHSCMLDVLKDIREEFDSMTTAYGEIMFWAYTGVKHKFTGRGNQGVIGNYAILATNPLYIYAYKSGILTKLNLTNARTNSNILRNVRSLRAPPAP